MRKNPTYLRCSALERLIQLVFSAVLYIGLSVQITSATIHTVKSDIPKDSCQTQIYKIEVAKGIGQDGTKQPSSDWMTLKQLPDFWGKRWPKYSGSAWYKIDWIYNCPNSQHTPVTLAIENINMAGQIYLNNEFLWQDQSLQEPLSRSWQMPRYWVLPASSLKHGENTLLIRVVGTTTQPSGLGQVYLGDYSNIIKIYENVLLEKRTLPLLNLMINGVVGMFCLLVWLFHAREKVFIWFALVCFSWASYVGIALSTQPLFSLSTPTLDRLHIFIFCNYAVFGCFAAWRFANRHYPRIEKLLIGFCGCAAIGLFLTPEAHLFLVLKGFFICAVVIFILKCLSFPFIAYRVKLPEAYLLAALYLSFFPIAVNDAYYMITHQGTILSPYTAPLSTLFIGVILALRLSKNAKRIEQFNKTLEESIVLAKRELTCSLNTQHQLALENVKLQERIHLSHDLHDGLGGSIVRSMIMLDRHESVEKPQMMSILKLLRNDLRQLIDSGSSIGAKVAENPMMWVAPIRHRFIQIFEEIEVESRWHFATDWQTPPSPLQSLSLSRVVEEALTNIIKHSRATQVDVTLVENQQHLILEVSDNGVGFNPDQVQEGLHVGLHSMQVRISRIGGEFKIISTTEHTHIRVTIPRLIST